MLLFKKLIFLFLSLSFFVSCSYNSNLNSFEDLDVSPSLSNIHIISKNERSHQIARLELEKIFNSSNSYNSSKDKNYSLDFKITESISGNILSTTLSTMKFNVTFTLTENLTNNEIFYDNFIVISSFGSVESLYGKEQAQKNTTTKLSISSATEIYLRLRYFFSNLKNKNETK